MPEPTYYETMYILRPDIPEEEVESHLTKYSDLLTKADVKVLDSQMRGKRRLAYPISKHKEGIYVQLSHQGSGQQVAVLERAMRLSEDVIRYLTVKQEGPLPTPKAPAVTEETKDKAKDTKNKEEITDKAKDAKAKEETKDKAKDTKNKEKAEEVKIKDDTKNKSEAVQSKEETKDKEDTKTEDKISEVEKKDN
tara:strand:+ start:1575 stop:2156 length:582 start_codon:yes stop_codon:yes gene_type:complete